MRNTWALGIILVTMILLLGALLMMGRQPAWPVENTTSIKVLSKLNTIETAFPNKADEIKRIVNEASLLEKELREENRFAVFLFGYPIDVTRKLSQLFNETEEKLADVFSLAYGENNTEELQESTRVVKGEMFKVWVLAQEFNKDRGILGFLSK